MLGVIRLTGATGIILLLTYKFTGKKQYALWGQILLITSFSLIAFVLMRGRAFWTGAAFAFAAIAQIYALAATRILKLRGPGAPGSRPGFGR